ncbi:MAG: aspartate/glutamate racemase family protein [Acetobacter okinawensis]|uniref:aspartate/glutamate racemase family protein n=1 Tax=Acetobacter okinawensis TaxID=1076594 RepID=UPI0039E9F5D2
MYGTAKGGYSLYGVPLGVLMLEAKFPRIEGDMGNATTWPFPVQLCIVDGVTPEHIVMGNPLDYLDQFIREGQRLIRLGVSAITTNCGFLALLQPQLAAALKVPVLASSLVQIPLVQTTLPPGKRVGIVTVCASSLTAAHLSAVGAPVDTPIAGTENGDEFFRILIRAESDSMDVDKAEQDVVNAALQLVKDNPDVGAIVLECTNMPPYAAAVAQATGLPVYDIYTAVSWFMSGLRPRRFLAQHG